MDVSSTLSRAGMIEPVDLPRRVAGSFLPVDNVAASIASGLSESVRRIPLPLEIQWVELLKRWDWQWFATFTFKDEKHPEAAAKVFRHWIKALDRASGYRERSVSTYSRRCVWARGLEWQKRGVIHFHVLLGNLPHPVCTRAGREFWAAFWLELGNTGYAKIDSFDQHEAGLAYVSKYCAKGGEVDVSPNLALPDLVGTAERS
jgi:hypothetical protein